MPSHPLTPRTSRRFALGATCLLLSCAVAARAQQTPRAELAVAESALAHGDMDRAVDLARHYTSHHETDWHGWFVQGEATLRRGGTDNAYRVAAIIAFRHAAQLAPERLEVWDGYGRSGLELGNADGELIIHEAYEKVLAMDPLYPNGWDNWLKAYRSGSDRTRMRRILALHDSVPEVRARIARLYIEDEQYPAANALLDSLISLDPRQPAWLALRAQSALETGDTTVGIELYGRALLHADRDGGGMLWEQAIGIATPGEIRAWEKGIPADQRPGFLRAFWARRNPDLFAGINQRIAEHFARLRYVRKEFQATHPLSSYKNRAGQRTLSARPGVGEQVFYQRCEASEVPHGPRSATAHAQMTEVMDSLITSNAANSLWDYHNGSPPPGEMSLGGFRVGDLDMPYGRGIRDIDTTAAALGYDLRTGLDDRGLTYLRFGAPRLRLIGPSNDVDPFCQIRDLERWEYDDIGTVRFFRPEAVNVGARAGWAVTGEEVFRPMNESQFAAMEQAMTRNATSIPAPLSFGVWTAQFAGRNAATTDVVVVTTRGAVAAQLTGAMGEAGPPWEDSSGVVVLHAKPGRYALMADAKMNDTLGRQGLRLDVEALGATPGVSDLLLAPAWADTLTTRSAMLRRLQRDLTFPAGATVRVFAEIYGLRPSVNGRVQYRVSYQIVPSRDAARDARRDSLPGGFRIAFDRDQASTGGPVREWLNIAPAQVPPGRYLLRLAVLTGSGAVVGRAQVGFQIRSE